MLRKAFLNGLGFQNRLGEMEMKLLEKAKGLFKSKAAKIAGFVILAVGNVVAITVTTIAWFALDTKQSNIRMVSGDLGVEIQKVTAYKYVYPYYKNSTEFIDYDSEGIVKSYVIEDHTLQFGDQNVDEITIGHDNAIITLGEATSGTYSTNINATHTASNIYFSNEDELRYYLIGDATFCGESSKEWSIKSAIAFKNNGAVSNNNAATVSDVIVSAGASFILFDKQNASAGSCYYFPYTAIDNNDSPFRIVDNNRILCLRSGIYNFEYTPGSLKITLKTVANQKEIAVIGNNSLDPTKITIDYAGSANKTTYPTLNSYLSHAIFIQNTMIILDVQINYTNVNPIVAGLQIERKSDSANLIYYDSNKYENTSKNQVGYVNEQTRNALNASDFYSFYAVFTKTPFAAGEDNEHNVVPVQNMIWNTIHQDGIADSKFQNASSFDTNVVCTLHLKEQNDSINIPPVSGDNIYHCYIGIDYDYIYTRYFLNENRLGKTYLLDRDFGFHFTGVQQLEQQSQGNGN